MSLVAYTITAIERDVADATISGKQVIAGATCSMYIQPADTVVTLYDDEAGTGGASSKVTGANGQVTVYVEGNKTYRLSVNGVDSYVRLSTDDASYDNVAEMVADSITDGVKVNLPRYYSGGDLVSGLNYYVKTAAQASADGDTVDGYINHTLANGNIAVLQHDGCINTKQAGCYADGSTDDATALQALFTYANNKADEVVFYPATHVVSSTLTAGRFVISGTPDASRIKPTISDGTACLYYPVGTNFLFIKGIRIDSGLTLSDFIDGTIDAQNCIGIQLDSNYPTTNSARFAMEDATVRGCKVGFDLDGFIGDLQNVWGLACETGLVGYQFNSVVASLRFEECRKELDISFSRGVQFNQYLAEGGNGQSGIVSSTIDDCQGVTFVSPYFEQARNTPFITFGGTTECSAISIIGLSLASQDDASSDYNQSLLHFDRVDGVDISGYFSTGSHHNRYTTTTNTKNIRDYTSSSSDDAWGPHDASTALSPAYNYFPNPNFDTYLNGWPALTVTRAAVAQETTLVRRGQNAVRLTYNAAQTSAAVLSFVMNEAALTPTQLAGKKATAYAWVWIPDTTDFDSDDQNLQTVQPYMSIYTDGTGGGTSITGTHHSMKGQWNLFKLCVDVPSDVTRIDVAINMVMGSGSSAGTEYIVVDSVYLLEGDCTHTHHVVNGTVQDSRLNPVSSVGGRLIQHTDTVPTDADMSYSAGDTFYYLNPSAGGFMGEVVTTAGTGATKVTKTFGAVTA